MIAGPDVAPIPAIMSAPVTVDVPNMVLIVMIVTTFHYKYTPKLFKV